MEEKEIALKQKEEEEFRIKEENRRIKEWEEKFDKEQKIKEEELLKKFYTDNSGDKEKEEVLDGFVNDDETINVETDKNN